MTYFVYFIAIKAVQLRSVLWFIRLETEKLTDRTFHRDVCNRDLGSSTRSGRQQQKKTREITLMNKQTGAILCHDNDFLIYFNTFYSVKQIIRCNYDCRFHSFGVETNAGLQTKQPLVKNGPITQTYPVLATDAPLCELYEK